MAPILQEGGANQRELVRTARIAGLFYLGSIITAVFGHFIIPAQIFAPANATTTLSQLVERETLARLGIVMDLASATFQALLSLWFYRLFRSVDTFLAGPIGVLGTVNAVLVFAAVAFLGSALDVALDPSLNGAAETAQLMYVTSGNFWKVVTVFFGLWLVPMGMLVLRSGWMPRLLGYLLIAGGIGYVIHAFIQYLAPDVAAISAMLVWLSVSEFWMAGYLLTKGVRRSVVSI